MNEGIQHDSSQFFLKAPRGSDTEPVGTVTAYDLKGNLMHASKVDLACAREPANDWFCHPIPLGSDLYSCATWSHVDNVRGSTHSYSR